MEQMTCIKGYIKINQDVYENLNGYKIIKVRKKSINLDTMMKVKI